MNKGAARGFVTDFPATRPWRVFGPPPKAVLGARARPVASAVSDVLYGRLLGIALGRRPEGRVESPSPAGTSPDLRVLGATTATDQIAGEQKIEVLRRDQERVVGPDEREDAARSS